MSTQSIRDRIQCKLASGRYQGEEEVLSTALDLLDEFELAERESADKFERGLRSWIVGKDFLKN